MERELRSRKNNLVKNESPPKKAKAVTKTPTGKKANKKVKVTPETKTRGSVRTRKVPVKFSPSSSPNKSNERSSRKNAKPKVKVSPPGTPAITKYFKKTSKEEMIKQIAKQGLQKTNELDRVFSFDEGDTSQQTKPKKSRKVTKKNRKESPEAKKDNIVSEVHKKLHINNEENSTIQQKKFFKSSINSTNMTVNVNFFSQSKPKKTSIRKRPIRPRKPKKEKKSEDGKEEVPQVTTTTDEKEEKPAKMNKKVTLPTENEEHEQLEENSEENKETNNQNEEIQNEGPEEDSSMSNCNCEMDDIEDNEPEKSEESGKNKIRVISDEIVVKENQIPILSRKTGVVSTNPFRQTTIFNKRSVQQNLAPGPGESLARLNSVNNLEETKATPEFSRYKKEFVQSTPISQSAKQISGSHVLGNKNINRFVLLRNQAQMNNVVEQDESISPPQNLSPSNKFSSYKAAFIQSTPLVHNVKHIPGRRVLGENTNLNRLAGKQGMAPLKSVAEQAFENKKPDRILSKLFQSPLNKIQQPFVKDVAENNRHESIVHKENIMPANGNNFTVEATIEAPPSKINRTPLKPKSASQISTPTVNFDEIVSIGALSKSTPSKVNKTQSKVTTVSNLFNIDNAFGFDSLEETKKSEKAPKKLVQKQLQIKPKPHYLTALKKRSHSHNLNYFIKTMEDVINSSETEVKEKSDSRAEREESKEEEKKETSKTNAADWSNLFDIDDFEPKEEEDQSQGFFTLLKQPVKRSYKRKRPSHEDQDHHNDDESEHHEKVSKKKVKRAPRVSKEEKKWIQEMNKTFEEIEKHDLCVE